MTDKEELQNFIARMLPLVIEANNRNLPDSINSLANHMVKMLWMDIEGAYEEGRINGMIEQIQKQLDGFDEKGIHEGVRE